MARLVPRDGYVKEVDLNRQSGTKRLRADKDGLFRADNPKDIAALKAQGFTEGNLALHTTGDNSRGYNCTNCGFGSWFKLCSRCGHDMASDPKTDGD
jgi:hypothetical protein